MTPMLLEPARPGPDGDPKVVLQQLREEMEKPYPKHGRVAEKADTYRDRLNHSILPEWNAQDLRGGLLEMTGPDVAVRGWEDARQRSFAISAYYRSLEAIDPARTDARTAALVEGLAEVLRPPAGLDAPWMFDAARVREYLDGIHDRLTNH